MHTPTPHPMEGEEEPDVKQPPVPPDQEPEVVPQREPPQRDEKRPLIALRDSRVAP
jgi:hypothetical protein